MTNSKATKKALFGSVVSLLLCFTMLIGATFAWFTDNVKNTGNKILAGDLEVKLLMHDGSAYQDISENKAPIFGAGSIAQDNHQETVWEPGKTQVVYLGVKNAGNLALKYNIILDIVDNGLAGALEYVVVPGANVEESINVVTDWALIKDQAQALPTGQVVAAPNGTLDEIVNDVKNETEYFALVIHMKEEAGNEYENTSVAIDILVNATQVDAELDSFGKDYDAGAEYEDVAVKTIPENTEAELTAGEVTVTIPAQTTAAEYELKVEYNGTNTNANGETEANYDITLYKDGAVASGATYLVEIQLPTNLYVTKLTHNGNGIANFGYNMSTGILSFETDGFSPFEITYKELGNSYDPEKDVIVTNGDELKQALADKVANIFVVNNCYADDAYVVDYNVVINSNGATISRANGYTGTIFSVKAGGKLSLGNIIVDGGAAYSSDNLATATNSGVVATGAMIATEGNGSIVLNSGTVVKNNDGTNAVYLVKSGKGTLTLNGAQIIKNRSAAGAIWGGGAITVNEGSKISYNHATSIGGAIRMVSTAGTFTMNGGEMNYNSSAGTGGAIWGGNKATYNFNGGEMAYNSSVNGGGAIWTGTYEKYIISGDFKLHDNSSGDLGGAIRFCDHSSLTMTGGQVYNNTVNGVNSAFYLNNNSATITGGSITDNFSYGGGLGLKIGNADIDGTIAYGLSTNHNTAYLAADFSTIKFTVNEEAANFSAFNFKPDSGYVYTAGDEAKLICLNDGYATYWDETTGTFRLKAE